jgi:hypothetical protein
MPRTVSQRTKDWVRKSAEYQFNCTVRIFRNGTPTLNTTTGLYEPVEGTELYNGSARIWSVDTSGFFFVGENDLSRKETYCSIPWDHEPVPRNDDTVEVLLSPDDSDLDGKSFRIMSVDGGGQILPTRRMRLVGLAENRSWVRD